MKMEWYAPFTVPTATQDMVTAVYCNLGSKVFELRKDGNCIMNVPDFEEKKYVQEFL